MARNAIMNDERKDPNDPKYLPLIRGYKKEVASGIQQKYKGGDEVTETGFVEATTSKFRNESLFGSLWRSVGTKSARAVMGEAPKGWSASKEIRGFYEPHREYLEEAQNPAELALRKSYVIDRINHERRMARLSTAKNISSSIVAPLMDPFTILAMSLSGGAAAAPVAALGRAGVGVVGRSIVGGAITGAAAHAMETSAKKLFGSDVVEAEFHPVEAAVAGACLGAVHGALSSSARLARFNIEHPEAKGNFDLYAAKEREMTKMRFGNFGEAETPAEKLARMHELRKAVTQYSKGELPASEYRKFKLDEGADKLTKILSVNGTLPKMGAGALNWAKRKLSVQMNMLTSGMEQMRVMGMKIFPTATYEEGLMSQVGEHTPLLTEVTMRNGVSDKAIATGYKDGWKGVKKEGFNIDKKEYNSRLMDCLSSAEKYDAEPSAAIKSAADKLAKTLDDVGEYAHQRGAFEFQKRIKAELREAEQHLINSVPSGGVAGERWAERQAEGLRLRAAEGRPMTEGQARALETYTRIKGDYDRAMSAGGLAEAKARMGDGKRYFPRRLSGERIMEDRAGAIEILKKSYIEQTGESARKRLVEEMPDIMAQTLGAMEGEGRTFGDYWKALRGVLKSDEYKMDYFVRPKLSAKMSGQPLSPSEFMELLGAESMPFRKGLYEEAEKAAIKRADEALNKAYGVKSVYGRKLSLVDTLEKLEQEVVTPSRGSLRTREWKDNYDTIKPLLEDDVLVTMRRYTNGLNSDAAMIERFGDEHAEGSMRKVMHEYKQKLDEISNNQSLSAGEKRKLTGELKRDRDSAINSAESAINYIRGFTQVNWGNVGEFSMAQRLVGIVSNWNVARFLSNSIFAQAQDVANVALRNEGWKTFGQTLSNLGKTLVGRPIGAEMKAHAAELGIGSSIFTHSLRSESLITAAERGGLLGGIEKATEKVARTAIKYSGTELLDRWTQSNASYLASCELDRLATLMKKGSGNLSEFQQKFARDYRLTPEKLAKIGEQIEKHSVRQDGVFSINLSEWTDSEAVNLARSIQHDNAMKATMVPGADAPPIFRSPIGKLMFQFRIFATATFGRMFVPALESEFHGMAAVMGQCLILETFGQFMKSFGKASAERYVPSEKTYRKTSVGEDMLLAFDSAYDKMDLFAWASDPTGFMQTLIDPNKPTQFGGTFQSFVKDTAGATSFLGKKMLGGPTTEKEKGAFIRMIPFHNHFGTRSATGIWRQATSENNQ